MTLVDDTPITTNSRQRRALMAFLEQTGYGPSDILSLNYETNIFLTRGGGKYQLKNGRVVHLSGPSKDPEERM
jgi:hypothetical protein